MICVANSVEMMGICGYFCEYCDKMEILAGKKAGGVYIS